MISEATKVAAVWALLNDGRVGDILDTLDGDARERDLQDWLWYYDTTLDACPPMPLAQALGELADEVDRDRDQAQLDSPDRLPALLECLRGEVAP